jgi:hypothetical protein
MTSASGQGIKSDNWDGSLRRRAKPIEPPFDSMGPFYAVIGLNCRDGFTYPSQNASTGRNLFPSMKDLFTKSPMSESKQQQEKI